MSRPPFSLLEQEFDSRNRAMQVAHVYAADAAEDAVAKQLLEDHCAHASCIAHGLDMVPREVAVVPPALDIIEGDWAAFTLSGVSREPPILLQLGGSRGAGGRPRGCRPLSLFSPRRSARLWHARCRSRGPLGCGGRRRPMGSPTPETFSAGASRGRRPPNICVSRA